MEPTGRRLRRWSRNHTGSLQIEKQYRNTGIVIGYWAKKLLESKNLETFLSTKKNQKFLFPIEILEKK